MNNKFLCDIYSKIMENKYINSYLANIKQYVNSLFIFSYIIFILVIICLIMIIILLVVLCYLLKKLN